MTGGRATTGGPGPDDPYDWERYRRTCDPDLVLAGLGDLCLFLGGSWSERCGAASFTGELLKLLAKAQGTPEHLDPLVRAFPREALAWHVWMTMIPIPTAAELAERLARRTGSPR